MRLPLEGAAVTTRTLNQGIEIQAREVRQRVGLEPVPAIFHGIQLRGIGRKIRRMEVGEGVQPCLGTADPVGIEPIPEQRNHGQVPPRLLQEGNDVIGAEVCVCMQAEVPTHVVAGGRHAQGGDGRDLAMMPHRLLQDRCVTARTPGAAQQWRHQQTRFIQEYEPGIQACSVFFTRGQSPLTHVAMAVSSRSAARRVGFWGVQPSARNSRGTWPTMRWHDDGAVPMLSHFR